MMLDSLQQLSTAQAVTTSAMSINSVDIGPQSPGARNPIFGIVTVDQSATAASAATVKFQLVSSASANLSSPHVINSTGAISVTDLPTGRKPIVVKAPLNDLPSGHRYLGVQYTIGTGPLTAGAFSCVLTDTDVSGEHYPSGFTVY